MAVMEAIQRTHKPANMHLVTMLPKVTRLMLARLVRVEAYVHQVTS